jgi:DNA-binding response OmpR family regulator
VSGRTPSDRRDFAATSAILQLHLDIGVDGPSEETTMRLVLMTAARQATTEVLPALGLLGHQVRVVAPELSSLLDGDSGDVVLVDARHDLIQARTLCGLLSSTGVAASLVAVLSEGGLVALSADWGVDDVLLDTAGPAEVDARLKWATARRLAAATPVDGDTGVTKAGELVIDEHSYSAKLRGRTLDLTYKEFELLKYLAQHPGRVFSRAQLLQEIWGYDYFGGTRTVDVHVRRLRAKLGTEHEALIGTVRNVGYKLDQHVADATAKAAQAETDAELV